ncbi:hypothetical protein BGW42_003268 [Actinomortierella wolfii]|nr:hypothetical protein BGW42_003268 [Actinomortierella wolfii]
MSRRDQPPLGKNNFPGVQECVTRTQMRQMGRLIDEGAHLAADKNDGLFRIEGVTLVFANHDSFLSAIGLGHDSPLRRILEGVGPPRGDSQSPLPEIVAYRGDIGSSSVSLPSHLSSGRRRSVSSPTKPSHFSCREEGLIEDVSSPQSINSFSTYFKSPRIYARSPDHISVSSLPPPSKLVSSVLE